jgi:hypothetical protein
LEKKIVVKKKSRIQNPLNTHNHNQKRISLTDYVKVTFSVIAENINENVHSTIIELLSRIGGISDVNPTSGTNTINALALWNESEVGEKLEEIRGFTGVQDVIIQKSNKAIARALQENVNVSEHHPSFEIIKDPIGEVNRAKNNKDYFKAISFSCTVFEYYGKQILVWHFKNIGTPVGKKKLKELSLHSIVVLLYTHKIIDETTYNKILEVKAIRNDFVHDEHSIRFPSEQLQKAERTTIKAMDCIISLKAIFDDMNLDQ